MVPDVITWADDWAERGASRMRRIVLLLTAVGAVACATDSTSPNSVPQTVSGVYGLATVNGQGLPALLGQNDTAKAELLSGSIRLGADSSFVDEVSVRVTVPSGATVQADTIRGAYSLIGTTLVFQPNDGSAAYFLTVSDTHTLTEDDPGFLIVYRR